MSQPTYTILINEQQRRLPEAGMKLIVSTAAPESSEVDEWGALAALSLEGMLSTDSDSVCGPLSPTGLNSFVL